MTARAEAIHAAHGWLSQKPLFLDTETTGLKDWDEVCEVAVVDHDGAALMNTLIRPTRPISRSAANVHGISDAMVSRSPSFKDIWPTLRELVTGRLVVIYNLDYDLPRLIQSARANRIDTQWLAQALTREPGWHCAMKLYAQFYGEWDRYRGQYRWQKLGDAAGQCRIQLPRDLHRAHADADLARRVVMHMANAK